MRDALWPLLSNLFMSEFVTEFRKQMQYSLKLWLRYVGNVFYCIQNKKCNINDFVSLLNYIVFSP